MKNRKSQTGMTAISWVVVLGIFAFFVLIVLRLSPIYMENFSVSTSLESLADENFNKKSKTEIWSKLDKRLRMNNVTNVKREHLKLTKSGGKVRAVIEYEVRVSMIGNVSAVVAFNDEVEL